MARTQVAVEELVRQEESQFIDRMGELDAERSARRDANEEIETGITRMRETVTEAFPNIEASELNRLLSETRITLRRNAGLEPPLTSQNQLVATHFPVKIIVMEILLLLFLLVGGMVVKYHNHQLDKSVATESQASVSIEAKHTFVGPNYANITIYCSTDADEVLLYRNTSVIHRWKKGGSYSIDDYHDRGTYVYYVEAFKHGVKTTSNQVQVVFGQQPAEKEVAR